MTKSNLYIKRITGSASKSAWSTREKGMRLLWLCVYYLFFRFSPKHPFNLWRLFLLRIFGAKIEGRPFVFSSTIIFAPWLLFIKDHCCLGPHTEIYNLGPVSIGERSVISQYAYICNGTHDFTQKSMPLLVGDVEIGNDVFIGAKAVVLPGVKLEDGVLVGAGSIVTKNVDKWTVVAGNPARYIRQREHPI